MSTPSIDARIGVPDPDPARPAVARRGRDRAGSGVHLARHQDHADHRHLRQGRHRQELHAGQPELHDGAAGQEGAAHRLRPEERHHQPAVRRQGLPDHHRDQQQEEARRRGGGHRRRLLQARRRLRDGTRRPRGRPRLRRARHHPRLRDAGKARLPRLGLRLRAARLPGRRGLRRLRPADRARHVPEGHRRRQQRPAEPVRRQQRVLGGRVLPQARWQRRRGRRGHQPRRRHRRSQEVRRSGRHPGAGHDPGQRRHPPQERVATKSSAGPARSGRRCSRSWPPTSPRRRRCGPSRRRRTSCWACSRPR